MVAVQLHGTHTDLKNIIQQSGMKLNMTDMNPGEPNDETFVKQVFKSVVELIPLYLKVARCNICIDSDLLSIHDFDNHYLFQGQIPYEEVQL